MLRNSKTRPLNPFGSTVSVRSANNKFARSIEVQPGQVYDPRAVARDIRRLHELGYFGNIEVDADAQPTASSSRTASRKSESSTASGSSGTTKFVPDRSGASCPGARATPSCPTPTTKSATPSSSSTSPRDSPTPPSTSTSMKWPPPASASPTPSTRGRKARVRSIEFVGNETLSDRQLRKLMQTRRSWWFIGGRYDEATFEADLQRIVDEYGNYGRLEAEIVETEIVQPEGEKGVDIVIHVSEGPVYHVDIPRDRRQLRLQRRGDPARSSRPGPARRPQPRPGRRRRRPHRAGIPGQRLRQRQGAIRRSPSTASANAPTSSTASARATSNTWKRSRSPATPSPATKSSAATCSSSPASGSAVPEVRASQRRLENTRYFERVRITLEDPDDTDPFANLHGGRRGGPDGRVHPGRRVQHRRRRQRLHPGPDQQLRHHELAHLLRRRPVVQRPPVHRRGARGIQHQLHRSRDLRLSFCPSASTSSTNPTSITRGTDFSTAEPRGPGALRQGPVALRHGPHRPSVPRHRHQRHSLLRKPRVPARTGRQHHHQQPSGESTATPSISAHRPRHGFAARPRARDSRPRGRQRVPQASARLDCGTGPSIQTEKWVVVAAHPRRHRGRIRLFRLCTRSATDSSSAAPPPSEATTPRISDPKCASTGSLAKKSGWAASSASSRTWNSATASAIGFRLYTFVDAGGVWSEASDFDIGDMKVGAGLGFGVDVPRLGPIRLDYGIPINPDDDQGSGRLHFRTDIQF
jgi:hypothetical protein